MKRLLGKRYRRTSLMLMAFMAVIAGLAQARLSNGWHWPLSFAFVWLVVAILCARKRNLLSLLAITLCGFSFGAWRGAAFVTQLSQYDTVSGQAVILQVTALNDGVYGTGGQITFDGGHLVLQSGQSLVGKIAVGGFGVGAVYQGDILRVEGKLKPGFGASQGKIGFGSLTLLERHPSLISTVRRKFTAGMQTALPEPLAPFSMGLLVGQRATLPDGVKQDLLMVGLTHIIAVSGYNLTIILDSIQKLLKNRSRRAATAICLAFIATFLAVTGLSASIVRAAVVSSLRLVAKYYGRSFKPLNIIMLAAMLTAWANPVYLWSDISWYLSFLAFYGVMVLSPMLQARWPAKWHQTLVGGVVLESLCAECMTLSFILHNFGQMSLVGLLANVLVATLIPLAMLLGLIAGLAGMLITPWVGWFAWPARLLLTYMLDTAHALAQLPHIFIEGIGLSLGQMLALYALIVGLSLLLHGKTKATKHAIVTDKKSIFS